MAEPDQIVANHTLTLLRTMDRKLDHVLETLGRHDLRLGRVERDLGELKSDVVLRENRVLTQTTEILNIVHRLSEHEQLAGERR